MEPNRSRARRCVLLGDGELHKKRGDRPGEDGGQVRLLKEIHGKAGRSSRHDPFDREARRPRDWHQAPRLEKAGHGPRPGRSLAMGREEQGRRHQRWGGDSRGLPAAERRGAGRGASMEEGAPGRLLELERRNGGRSRCLDGVDAREGRSRGVADLGAQEGSPDLGKSRPRGKYGRSTMGDSSRLLKGSSDGVQLTREGKWWRTSWVGLPAGLGEISTDDENFCHQRDQGRGKLGLQPGCELLELGPGRGSA
jgi:hypothetical protein